MKNLEYAAYLHFVDGGRLYDVYYKGYEHRKFDELVVFAIIAGQALVRAVYYRIGVDGVNYGAQMVRLPFALGCGGTVALF